MWRWIRREFGGIARLIAGSDTIFIGAVNGAAAGVGLAWALTCDLVIASERAVIVPAFGRLGLIPEVGTSWALTRRLGYQGALAYYLRGDHIDAGTALRLGLVQEVVEHDRLLAAADEWCSRIANLPPHAAAMTKPLLRAAADADRHGALFRSLETARRRGSGDPARARHPVYVGEDARDPARRPDPYNSVRRWPRRGLRSRLTVAVGEPIEPTALEIWLTARWGAHTRKAGRTW